MNTERSLRGPLLRLLAGAALGLVVTVGPVSAQDWRPLKPDVLQLTSEWRGLDPAQRFEELESLEYTSILDEGPPAPEPPMPGTVRQHEYDPASADAAAETAPQPGSDAAIIASTGPCGTCGVCACDCRPQWYGGVEVVWLDRSRPEPFSVSVLDISPPAERIVLNTEDIGFRYEPGLRLTLGHWLDDCTSIEAQYLGLHDWNEGASSGPSAGNDLDPFWGNDIEDIATGNFQNAHLHEISYESELHSFEVNRRRWNGPDSSRFVGLRYVYIDEDFALLSFDADPAIDPNDIGLYEVDTTNHLIGVHVGGMRQTSGDRFKFGVRGKAGLFLNFLSQESHLLDVNPANTPAIRTDLRTSESDVTLATVIELGAYGLYRVSDRCWLRAGYDVLFISGLALASEQLDVPQWENSRAFLSDNGSVIYHGPSAGVMVNW